MRLETKAKLLIAAMLCSKPVAWCLDLVFRGTIPVRGMRIWAGPPHVSSTTRAAIFFRLYERAELAFVDRYLRRDLDVVELGASIGVVSAAVAARLAEGPRLIAVEANPALGDHIRRNVAAASPSRRLMVEQKAISYEAAGDRTVRFAIGTTNIASKLGEGGRDGLAVQATTLGALLEGHAVEQFTLVCDIEGAEAGILMADAAALEQCQLMIMELHESTFRGKRFEPTDLVEVIVHRLGFEVLAQRGPVYVFNRPTSA